MATADAEKLLVVAAEARELAGVLRHCRNRAKLRWPVHFARSAELGGLKLFLVANGWGAGPAGEACETAWNKQRADRMISVGFCGALDPLLRAGDVFVATRVESPDGSSVLACGAVACHRPHSTGALISSARVVRGAEEKQILRKRGAGAVDMEAHAVGLRARQWGVPFYCIRTVTDLAEEDLQLDFNAARGADGRLSVARLLWAAAQRPKPLASELIKLYHRSQLAARALGDFLADCRY